MQFYFLKFATDVLLLPPAVVGVLFALAKLWDAVSNPLVGSWSDRTRSRFGRRRPFLLGSLPLLVAGFVMLWSPPEALGMRRADCLGGDRAVRVPHAPSRSTRFRTSRSAPS